MPLLPLLLELPPFRELFREDNLSYQGHWIENQFPLLKAQHFIYPRRGPCFGHTFDGWNPKQPPEIYETLDKMG